MNHLPQKNAEHIAVPLIARQRLYFPGDFFRLPWVYKISGAQLAQTGPNILPTDDQPAFLQGWLFFALLAVVLNREIEVDSFCQQRGGEAVVDTSDICSLLSGCSPLSSVLSAGDHDWNHRTRAILALEEARKFVLAWCSDKYVYLSTSIAADGENTGTEFRSRHRELCLSFGIMGETLDRFCTRQMDWSSPRTDHRQPYGSWEDHLTDDRSWGFSNLLRERMIGLGWCRHEVRRITATAGDLSSMYYISSFEYQPAIPQDHSRCIDDQCVLDPWDGFSIHCEDCDGAGECDRILPDENELVRIIEAGNIPLLHLEDDAHLTLTERMFSAEPFVAISHAWSDGLGPSDGQGLPRCRLARIYDALQKDTDETSIGAMGFWIDSLCIPRLESIRNRAIQSMGDIYSRAHTVMVLDSNLRVIPADPEKTPQLEAIIRINTGSWCTRMWTLPEGVQARNVHFEFSDRLLSIRQLRGHYKDVKHNPVHPHHHVYKAGWVFSPSIFILRRWMDTDVEGGNTMLIASTPPTELDSKSIGHLWLSMQWRRTTRPQDETLCLARLLDFDPLPILNCSDNTESVLKDSRMVAFLGSLDEHIGIPSAMIFLPGPKLPIRGFAWAPHSWMTRRSRDAGAPLLVADQRPSFLTLRGLQVQYPGVQLHPHPAAEPPPRCFWIPTARNLRRWLRIRHARDVPGQGEADWAAAWSKACAGDGLPCIIRSRFDEHDEPEMGALVQSVSRRREAGVALSGALPGRSDVLWVKVLCRVWIQVETDSAVVARHSENFRLHVGLMTWGEMLGEGQRWVVDGEYT